MMYVNFDGAVRVGLCAGRHEIPVDEYIFDSIPNPSDIEGISRQAESWVYSKCGVHTAFSSAVNQVEDGDALCYVGSPLVVYVTGLTVACTAVIRACALYGVPLVLMHYNRDTGEYDQQRIL